MFEHFLATHDTSYKWLFAQLAVVGHRSNTCFMSAIFTMCESTELRVCVKFRSKIIKATQETYELLQQAYSEDAMDCTHVFYWFR
jgi:hypothetical protein